MISESQESKKVDNLDIGAETQNLKFDAAIKTTRFSRHITHSENARQNLYENVKTISESQESKKVDNLNVGAETQNLKFDAAIKTTGFSCHVTHFENTRQNLHENVKTISESQERIAEIDKMSLKESYEAEESEQAERTNNLDVGAELQNSKFDAAIKTSSLSHKPGESEESERTNNLDVGAELQNSKFDAAIKTSRLSRKHKKNLQILVPKRRKEETNVSSNVTHSENVRKKLYENVKSISESQERLAEVDKIRIMQVNAHGALTSTKFSYLKEVIRLHKPDIVLVNEFGQPRDIPVFPKIQTFQVIFCNHYLGCTKIIQKEVLKRNKIEKNFDSRTDKETCRELVNGGIQEMREKHVENYELQGPNITLIEEMVKDLSKLLLKSEQEAVPKVKIKMKLKITASYVILEK